MRMNTIAQYTYDIRYFPVAEKARAKTFDLKNISSNANIMYAVVQPVANIYSL
jgi:hypothetical protein